MWNAPTAFRLLYPKPKSKISVPLNPEESPEMNFFTISGFLILSHTRGPAMAVLHVSRSAHNRQSWPVFESACDLPAGVIQGYDTSCKI
jgi:hypothetical protein